MLMLFVPLTMVYGHGEYMAIVKNDATDVSKESGNVCTTEILGPSMEGWDNADIFRKQGVGACWMKKDGTRATQGGFPEGKQNCHFNMKTLQNITALAGPGGCCYGKKEGSCCYDRYFPPYVVSPFAQTDYQELFLTYEEYGLHGHWNGIWHGNPRVFFCLAEKEHAGTTFHPNDKELDYPDSVMHNETNRDMNGCKYMMEATKAGSEGPDVKTEFTGLEKFWAKYGDELKGKEWVFKIVSMNQNDGITWGNKRGWETYTRCLMVTIDDVEAAAKSHTTTIIVVFLVCVMAVLMVGGILHLLYPVKVSKRQNPTDNLLTRQVTSVSDERFSLTPRGGALPDDKLELTLDGNRTDNV